MNTLYAIGLLIISNIFMTFAWYGHLKYQQLPLLLVILLSWMLALFEYIFQVPANRIGHTNLSAMQLKILQEIISLVIFTIFSVIYLGEPIKLKHMVGLVVITIGVIITFYK